MNLLSLLCLDLVLHCIDGQMAHEVDILTELKKVQKAQEECTKKFSELDEYNSRVLSLENTVKGLLNAVLDLERKNRELISEIHRMEHDKKQSAELNVNNFKPKTKRAVEGLPSVYDRRVVNATYHLQENVDKSMKRDDHRIRFAMKRSFTKRPNTTNPGPTNQGPTNPVCPATWEQYADSCYLFKTFYHLSFDDAETYCQQHHGHLVQIDNDRENLYVKTFLGNHGGRDSWIGLSDKQREGTWRWTSSSSVAVFTDWYPGEPSSFIANEDCVSLNQERRYKWLDDDCRNKFGTICELP